jgi:nucleotide-binding universal stress UspA family protein
MSIVCATDLTARSNPAVDAIVGLTARLGEREIWLVHVLNPETRELDPAAHALLRASAERILAAQAQLIRDQTSVDVHPEVHEGPVAVTLRAFAEAKRARLLVLGAPTPSALPVFQFAGTAERVIQASTVPVLVVRSAQGFRAWGRRERALRVVVGVDDTYSAQAVVAATRDLACAGDVALTAVEVYYAHEAGRRYGIPVRSWLECDPEVEDLVARDLARRVGDVPGATLKVRPQLGLGRLGDHLLDAIREEGADLVIVGTHDRRGLGRLGSASAVVLAFGDVSTLLVPEQAVAPQVGGVEIHNVLVATDFSDFAGQAVAYAYALLRGGGGVVHLLHVESDVAPAAQRASEDRLRALVPSPAPEGVVTHTHVVARTDVAAAIRETAERLGADVLCIASHGRSGVVRVVLGSVAEKVVRESRRPVLVVRPRQE